LAGADESGSPSDDIAAYCTCTCSLIFMFQHGYAAYVCSLRHPNVVFVYGVVVPALESKGSGENGDSGDAQPGPPIPQGAGMVRPPQLCAACLSRMSCMIWLHFKLPGHILVCTVQAQYPEVRLGFAEGLGGVCWQVRPPAIVTEYMSGGSLRSALSRRLEGVQGGLTRLLIALDAAKATLTAPCTASLPGSLSTSLVF
jgi:hypothetical protein